MKYWDLLQLTQAVSVATVDDSRPKVRPMTLITLKQRLFLATGKTDPKVRQLSKNPYMECLLPLADSSGNGYLRISGKALEIRDIMLKKEVADAAKFIYDYWQDIADESFILYQLMPDEWRYLKPGEDIEEIVR
ncbi:MAG: pyridoxamine 5'-phosphate oxidase family protein [Candidatus Cloacimonetes bacterium]|jgi:uncharacterized pyridoxamine 5'-phosphate oxidase family protein|nr:pyridoxamine 5'-phosphate oxidase family protein [Candidatus Cloacimonadota bacterium]MDY0298516.1 pyridoxamine 5'-phosphate oxidase family protein [Candidatus Cloacimonadaceae bacterium]MCB5278405.1 pyridoxamine 5'-phosphate oxidase family protein [Candidatus Cloacimonadota bacterium]MCK9333060.1 pyridoxamine 5'-phosphate oxidase family protein [Candidatus Cloacimonadota bacterium]MDD2209717.1 pyridoxamine 5'-phosphate oxidase family protein [Candidatus Cloacimonadota bacterium]